VSEGQLVSISMWPSGIDRPKLAVIGTPLQSTDYHHDVFRTSSRARGRIVELMWIRTR
jgi:hypothetical protein